MNSYKIIETRRRKLMQYLKLTDYELKVLNEIHEWKNPSENVISRISKVINYPIDKGYELVNKVPGVEFAIEKSMGGIVNLINEGAQWSVRNEAIYEEFRKNGYNINYGNDIFSLDLNHVDKVVGLLDAKYKVIAASEGAVTGAVGLLGIPADIIALLGLNLRAIGEYATYYGFDIKIQHERLFALNILGLASGPSDASKQISMAQLIKISQDVAKKKTWDQLNEHLYVKIIGNISNKLGQRLTKAKLAQIVPATGAIIGAGFNAYYTNKVCESAYYLYRERFLAQKYGADIIDISVEPTNDYDIDSGD